MPELPEVETVRSGLEKAWVGKQISKVILRRENLRYPFPKDLISRLEGSTIVAVRRRAKYLLIDTDGQEVLLSHLGMSGKYTLFDSQKVANFDLGDSIKQSVFGEKTGFNGKHDHMEIRFTDGSISVYTDPRRFGIVKIFHRAEEEIEPLLTVLGPEPLTIGMHKLLLIGVAVSAHQSRPLYSTSVLLSELAIFMLVKHCTNQESLQLS